MKLSTVAGALAILAAACLGPPSQMTTFLVSAQSTSVGSNRLLVFISDLHLGVGRDSSGVWLPYEDFRWEPEFRQFLDRVNREGGGRTDLVLNGDTFELWQSLESDCVYPDRNLGCTEADALHRIRRVLDQHRGELVALGDFAASGSNSVTLVPGNHDAALLFPGVASVVIAAIPAPAGRVTIAATGWWLSPDGLVYAEHGHQIGAEVNRFDGWPRPFVPGPGGLHLRRPWGEQFVQSYYNQFEAKYPIIDNITDDRAAVRFAMTAEGGLHAALDSAAFIRFFLLDVSWSQLGGSLRNDGKAPEWDVDRIQRQGGDRFLIESFALGDPVRIELERRAPGQRIPFATASLSPSEIRAVCDQRAALRLKSGTAGITACPQRDARLGAIAQRFTRSRDEVFSKHLKETAAALGQGARRFQLFVYSHTHSVDEGFNPLQAGNARWNPRVVNTGAWQRVVSPDTVVKWNVSPGDALRRTVDTLPACYSLVWISPYAKMPVGEVRSWRQEAGSSWDFGRKCD